MRKTDVRGLLRIKETRLIKYIRSVSVFECVLVSPDKKSEQKYSYNYQCQRVIDEND